MRVPLLIHPDFRCDAVQAISVEVARAGSGLALRYLVEGDIEALKLPPPAAPARADELWRHTCLEAFAADPAGYVEFNLAPSTQWAAYRFDSYRSGMRPADVAPPQIEVSRRSGGGFELRALIDPPPGARRLGLAAVIEDAAGRVSYWAARHPPGKPDFHHADGFALELPAPSRP
jgi:hypothetical protein